MTTLYDRDYRLVVNALEVSQLDIKFAVTRSLKKTDNTAEITIYNLREDHRKQIEDQAVARCTLEAGYRRDPASQDHSPTMSLIFAGDCREINSIRNDADWETTVSSRDGKKKRKKGTTVGRVAKGFAPGVSIKTVIQECAKAMHVGVGNLSALSKVEFPKAGAIFPNGTVLNGDAAEELEEILRSAGLEYSIQNGVLQILTRGQALAGTAVVLSPETGLVDSPTISSDLTARGRCLLEPDIFPGRKLQLKARNVSGFFRFSKCDYSGDTREKDWFVDFEARPIKAVAI